MSNDAKRPSDQGLPRKFLVWYQSPDREPGHVNAAVVAWMRDRERAGARFDFAQAGNVEFEVFPDVSRMTNASMLQQLDTKADHVFRNLITLHLVMNRKNPVELFIHDGIALYPEW